MLLKDGTQQEKKNLALEMFKVAGKLHAEWREAMLPVVKRMWGQGDR